MDIRIKEQRKKELYKRMSVAIKMRKQEKTLEEIGKVYGISRERIRQLGVQLNSPEKELFTREGSKKSEKVSVPCSREGCPVVTLKYKSYFKGREKSKFYCSRNCLKKYFTEEERKKGKAEIFRRRYLKDKKAYHKYQWEWRKSHPNSRAAINSRKYQSEYMKKNKDKLNARLRERWKNDPEFRKRQIESNKKSRLKRIARQKLEKSLKINQ